MMMIDGKGGGEKNVEEDEVGGGRRRTEGHIVVVEREHMFDKVVTPSDVGKLNRLVIPKQQAEKYFPLDSSSNEKGLLLNFEDRGGKQWRFRYSYWNSSQSYVMTKGWSRFVKEKKLDAGDVVSFQRGVGDFGRDRLFIDWRRRRLDGPSPSSSEYHYHNPFLGSAAAAGAAAGSLSLPHQYYPSLQHNPSLFLQQQPVPSTAHCYSPHPHNYGDQYAPQYMPPPPHHIPNSTTGTGHQHPHSDNFHQAISYTRSAAYHPVVNPTAAYSGSLICYRSAASLQQQQQQHEREFGMVQVQRPDWGGFIEPAVVFESVPVVQGKAAAKRLRLFGVNMDCPISTPGSSGSDDIAIVECNTTTTTTLSSSSSSSGTPTVTHVGGVSLAPHTYYPYCNSASTTPLFSNTSSYTTTTTTSSNSHNIPYIQLSPHTGTATTTVHPCDDVLNKGKSSMSFDLDI